MTFHIWRMAAEVVATDADIHRRQAYQDIIAVTREQLLVAATVDELITTFGRYDMQVTAIRAALCRHGKVLNAEVIVAAACWQHLCLLMAQHGDASNAAIA